MWPFKRKAKPVNAYPVLTKFAPVPTEDDLTLTLTQMLLLDDFMGMKTDCDKPTPIPEVTVHDYHHDTYAHDVGGHSDQSPSPSYDTGGSSSSSDSSSSSSSDTGSSSSDSSGDSGGGW